MKQNQFKFKPFDKVLVRNTEEQTWKANFYSFEGYNGSGHVCTNDMKYAQCIPYNENTAYLLGTCEPYEEPKPKTFHVVYENGDGHMFTDEEFKHFIETAVLNNKDVSHFAVHRL